MNRLSILAVSASCLFLVVSGESCRRLDENHGITVFDCPRLFEPPSKEWCCKSNTFTPKCCNFTQRAKEGSFIGFNAGIRPIFTFNLLVYSLIGAIAASLVVAICFYVIRATCRPKKSHQRADTPLRGGTSAYVEESGGSFAYPDQPPPPYDDAQSGHNTGSGGQQSLPLIHTTTTSYEPRQPPCNPSFVAQAPTAPNVDSVY